MPLKSPSRYSRASTPAGQKREAFSGDALLQLQHVKTFHSLGAFMFRRRDLLPVPLVLLLGWLARPRFIGWILGLPLILAGELFRLWALTHIGPTTRTREICADRLITTGPYALCRNPLYLANTLKVAGILIIGGNSIFAVLGMLFYALEFAAIITYEEEFLARKFPDGFASYSAEVAPFIPRSIGHGLWEAPAFSWAEAVRSEFKTFSSTGAILGFLSLLQWGRGSATEGRVA